MSEFNQPAEWTPHAAVWIGWPSAADLWEDNLGPARAEVEDFIRAIVFPGGAVSGARGEPVRLLVRGAEARAAAEIMASRLPDPAQVTLHEAPLGDIWLRDTGPIFTRDARGELSTSAFTFNGWGGKYDLPEDDRIADIVAEIAGVPLRRFNQFIGEGGALETDGAGTFITTRQCLLNANRNPDLAQGDIEAILADALGARHIIWLGDGLTGDHTDGHVDNLARFIAPGKVVCMRANGADDPNADVLGEIEEALRSASDANGRALEVVTIPSPGLVEIDGEPAAASHMNFYIANQSVVMPCYGRLSGDEAVGNDAAAILAEHANRPHVFAVDSSHILTGGGSFHCISQQQPV